MADYLLIGSRDPFESTDVQRIYALAGNLVGNGSKVTLFLVQNGVLAARENARSAALSAVAGNGYVFCFPWYFPFTEKPFVWDFVYDLFFTN